MDVNINLSIFYILLCFFIIFFVARKTIWAKLDAILSERHEMIEGAKQAASGNEEYVENKIAEINTQLAEARSKAFSTRQELRNEALDKQKGIMNKARGDAAEKFDAAQVELDAAVIEAKTQLRSESDEIAASITKTILGRSA